MKNPKTLMFHDDSGIAISVTYEPFALLIGIISPWSLKQTMKLEVIEIRCNYFGLPECERRIAEREISLSPVVDEKGKHLVGSCAIKGTFDKDWIERLYFRVV